MIDHSIHFANRISWTTSSPNLCFRYSQSFVYPEKATSSVRICKVYRVLKMRWYLLIKPSHVSNYNLQKKNTPSEIYGVCVHDRNHILVAFKRHKITCCVVLMQVCTVMTCLCVMCTHPFLLHLADRSRDRLLSLPRRFLGLLPCKYYFLSLSWILFRFVSDESLNDDDA